MATTLKLVAIDKIDRRKNGDISYASVTVEIDGIVTGATFRAKVGDEPVVIDGETITAPDAQVDGVRAAAAIDGARHHAEEAQRARFGTLPEIVAVSDAQRRYADGSRSRKLPLMAATLDASAAKWGWDAVKTERAFAHVAAQTDARWWIETAVKPESGLYGPLWSSIWYHFA